jgi:hypothetical protein
MAFSLIHKIMTARIPSEEIVRINIEDARAMNYYSDYFNCSRKDLEEAINKIGNCFGEVEIYLLQRHGSTGNSLWDSIKTIA